MSVLKIKKLLEKPLPEVGTDIFRKVVLISDSKGGCLRRVDKNLNIRYICKGGATFRQQFYFIKHRIATFGRNTHFLIFLGTCDLTCKNGKFIKLNSTTDESVQSVFYFTEKFREPFRKHGFSYSFLEIPPYTIAGWNSFKGHSSPDSFLDDDKILNHQIALVNERFKEINRENLVQSPRFSLDLYRSHTSSSRRGSRPSKYNFKLYTDGIHPSEILSRCWLRSIVLHIIKYCS